MSCRGAFNSWISCLSAPRTPNTEGDVCRRPLTCCPGVCRGGEGEARARAHVQKDVPARFRMLNPLNHRL
eukprot:1138916-Pelagomonas_calceolata.AAC.2